MSDTEYIQETARQLRDMKKAVEKRRWHLAVLSSGRALSAVIILEFLMAMMYYVATRLEVLADE
jgi:hypothetical protein